MLNPSGDETSNNSLRDFTDIVLHHNDPVSLEAFVIFTWFRHSTNESISPNLRDDSRVPTMFIGLS